MAFFIYLVECINSKENDMNCENGCCHRPTTSQSGIAEQKCALIQKPCEYVKMHTIPGRRHFTSALQIFFQFQLRKKTNLNVFHVISKYSNECA